MKNFPGKWSLEGTLLAVFLLLGQGAAYALTSVTDTNCNARVDITVSSGARSSTTSNLDCQERDLTSASGFALTQSNPTGAVVADSSAMVSAGGELYEAFVASAREAAVLLTPNRALMMSRDVSGNGDGVDWNMGLAVQPVTGGTNAWLTGTYTLLRVNREVRIVDSTNQTDDALSQIFDPVTLRIAFDGNSGCTVTGFSSWFGYSLTTDPAGAYSQPNGSDYGLHQAVYAGEGYAGTGGVHPDSNLTFTACDYVLGSDGKLLITYDYTDGDAGAFSIENAYFVSADLRYLVSTVEPASNLYRGFEVGVRVKTISGTQDERNDGVAGTYLFNAPALELQGATGVLSEPDHEHRNSEKSTQCMLRGSLVLSTTASATTGWNTCTFDTTSTCSVRGEENEAPNIALSHYTAEGSETAAGCRFQVATDGSLDLVINQQTAEGAQDVTYDGAIADNNETLVLRGKYVGSDMTDPSDTNPPQRDIKNDLMLSAVVGIQYEGSLVADADSDGLSNLGEFLYSSYSGAVPVNDINGDGISDGLLRNTSSGAWKVFNFDSSRNAGSAQSTNLYTSSDYVFQAMLDLDADGDDDILTRKSSDGSWVAFIMNGNNYASTVSLGMFKGSDYTFQGALDVDADGDDDVLLRRTSDGVWRLFIIQSAAVSSSSVPTLPFSNQDWQMFHTGDFDGDGDDDVIERRVSDGKWRVFYSDAGDITSTATMDYMYTSSLIVETGVGDADGDGDADVLLRRSDNGRWLIHAFSGGVAPSGAVTVANMYTNSDWVFQSFADYDGDGDTDVLMRRTSDGVYRTFEIENHDYTGQTSQASMYSSSTWQLQTHR